MLRAWAFLSGPVFPPHPALSPGGRGFSRRVGYRFQGYKLFLGRCLRGVGAYRAGLSQGLDSPPLCQRQIGEDPQPRRRRRTKAEIEADNNKEQSAE